MEKSGLKVTHRVVVARLGFLFGGEVSATLRGSRSILKAPALAMVVTLR